VREFVKSRLGSIVDNSQAEKQLQDVLSISKIDTLLPRAEQLDRLRQIPYQELVAALSSLRLNSFRAVTDQDFIHRDMIDRLRDGTVAEGFRDRGMKIIIGEAETEVCCPRHYNCEYVSS
jgi:carboxylesterase type B